MVFFFFSFTQRAGGRNFDNNTQQMNLFEIYISIKLHVQYFLLLKVVPPTFLMASPASFRSDFMQQNNNNLLIQRTKNSLFNKMHEIKNQYKFR